MNRFVDVALIVAGVVAVSPPSLGAQAGKSQQQPAVSPPRIKVCSLLPKEDVKKHLPWIPALDQMPPEEEAIGASGSSCNYPSVMIQVLPFSQRMIDLAREKGGLETVRGIGDESYFHNNRNQYAELYVKSGKHLLTIQANANPNIESVKPGVLNLAKVLVGKLP